MAAKTTFHGVLLAIEHRTYKSFTDRETGEVKPAGATYWLWLAESFNAQPQRIKVTAKNYPLVAELDDAGKFGTVIDVECWINVSAERTDTGARAIETLSLASITAAPAGAKLRTA